VSSCCSLPPGAILPQPSPSSSSLCIVLCVRVYFSVPYCHLPFLSLSSGGGEIQAGRLSWKWAGARRHGALLAGAVGGVGVVGGNACNGQVTRQHTLRRLARSARNRAFADSLHSFKFDPVSLFLALLVCNTSLCLKRAARRNRRSLNSSSSFHNVPSYPRVITQTLNDKRDHISYHPTL
jgi:hypothetical protein